METMDLIATRIFGITIEILYFYFILRGIDRFKLKENLVFIFQTSQHTRWLSMIAVVCYIALVTVLLDVNLYFGRNIHMIGAIITPVLMVRTRRTSIQKILFGYLLMVLSQPLFAMFYHLIPRLSATSVLVLSLLIIAFFVEFDGVYHFYEFLSKKTVWYQVWCIISFVIMVMGFIHLSSVAGYIISVSVIVLVMLFIYLTIKAREAKLLKKLSAKTYPEIKAHLSTEASHVFETSTADAYYLNLFWISTKLKHELAKEFERLQLVFTIKKERDRLKIHILR